MTAKLSGAARTAQLAAVAVAVVAVVASCAPPPTPAPAQKPPAPAVHAPTTTTSTTTTTAVPLRDPVPGFVRSHIAPRLSYTVSHAGLPPEVHTALVTATRSAAELSGIDLELSSNPSGGEAPVDGEIRVRMGNLCASDHAVGCAVVYGTSRHIVATDMSISPSMVGDNRLQSVVLHELGHALGLNHVDTAGFKPQVMGNNGEPLMEYQTGDRDGLAAAGADAVAESNIGIMSVFSMDPARVIERHELTVDHTHTHLR